MHTCQSTQIVRYAFFTRMCAHDVHAQCDVTRFAYDASHITMMSPVFEFHLCHVRMSWHDVIGVHIARTPHHHVLHHMGMV